MKLNDLSEKEKEALQAYKSARPVVEGAPELFCFEMNARLQAGLFPSDMQQHFKEHIEALDSVFNRAPITTESMTLFRGIIGPLILGPLRTGQCFRNLSFWSASENCGVAEGFIKPPFPKSIGILAVLKLPAGMRVYDMETLPGAGGSEREILLPRGILWRLDTCAARDKSSLLPSIRNDLSSYSEYQLTAVSSDIKAVRG